MSLPRANRITQQESFSKAFKQGSSKAIDGMKIHRAPEPGLRIGVVIPKKMVKLSVDRHRLKRRIYATALEAGLHDCMLVVQVTKKMNAEYDLSALQKTLHEIKP